MSLNFWIGKTIDTVQRSILLLRPPVIWSRFPRGHVAECDLARFTGQRPMLTIFDVGANIGQSVDAFKKTWPHASIHSFEPSPSIFAQLNKHCNKLDGVTAWNLGIGSRQVKLPFLENTNSDMSSFLAPSTLAWGKIRKTTDVELVTLD